MFELDSKKHSMKNPLIDSINYFLIEISGKVQVSKTKREKAESHYEAISGVLKSSPENTLLHKLDVKMRPFGGFGSNTAVHPFQKDEFDLDLVIQFMTTTQRFGSAERLYNEVFVRLYHHETYRGKIERKDRCIRLNYAGDFHLDLMPAIPFSPLEHLSSKLWISELQDNGSYKFVLVDPLGLNAWFEKKCALQKTSAIQLTNDRADFEIMPLTSEEARKPALKQAVQLLKRARDVFFYNDSASKKILKSVVILTIAGQCYEGETDLYNLIKKILFQLEVNTQDLATARIENPVHQSENFLDSLRENPHRYQKLRKFISTMRRRWDLLAVPNTDLEDSQSLLVKIFGESVANEVLSEYGKRLSDSNRDGRMKMLQNGNIAATSAIGSKIPRHEFFGDL